MLKFTKCDKYCEFSTITSFCFDCPALMCNACKCLMHESLDNKNHKFICFDNKNLKWNCKEIIENLLADKVMVENIFTEVSRMFINELNDDNDWICSICSKINPSNGTTCNICCHIPIERLNIITKSYKKLCPICVEDYPIPEMLDLMACEHSFCKGCMIEWLREVVESKYPCKWNCPCCDETKYLEIDRNMYYNQLRKILDSDKHLINIFESKLLQEQLMKNPNFHWCANEECTNGFEDEGTSKIHCPSCKSFMCGKCNRMWHESHEGISCQEFELWILKNDPNLSNLLKNIGIECPGCGMRYALAAGGSLHFDCKSCGVKFCGGCDQLFVNKCNKPGCKMTNFHSHHPRNCIYFLRDYETKELENMLKETDYIKLQDKPNKKCQYMITNDTLKDIACGRDVYSTTGICYTHYKEYLVKFVNRYQIDPADFVDSKDLNLMLFLMALPQLTQLNQENKDAFKARLKKEVKEKCLFYTPKGFQ